MTSPTGLPYLRWRHKPNFADMLASLEAHSWFKKSPIFKFAWSLAPPDWFKFKMKPKQKSDEQKINFHWFKRKGTLILHQSCVSYNRIICSRGIQMVLSTFKSNQLDTKGLLPAQGRNKPSHKNRLCHQDRWCHQEVEPSTIKIGKGLITTSRLDLL